MGITETFAKVGTGAHAALYKLLGGRFVGASDGPGGLIVVTTKGRKTGKLRSRPLAHMRDGENLLVVASAGGSDEHPDWYLNMEADPRVTVHIADREERYRARIATGKERDELFARFVELNKAFASYAEKTSRTLPVVVLEPDP